MADSADFARRQRRRGDKASRCFTALPRSNPVQGLVVQRLQQLIWRRHVHSVVRDFVYGRRASSDAEFSRKIEQAMPEHVAALRQAQQAEFDRRMVVIRRFNFGPSDVVGSGLLFDGAVQTSLQTSEVPGVADSDVTADLLIDEQHPGAACPPPPVPWPPSATITSTPCRPGAPSVALPH